MQKIYSEDKIDYLEFQNDICITNDIRKLISLKRGIKPLWVNLIKMVEEYCISHDLCIIRRNNYMQIKPNKELNNAIDYDQYVLNVAKGRAYEDFFDTNIKIRYSILTSNSLQLLLSDKCTDTRFMFKQFQLNRINIKIFLNKRNTNIYLIMEILDKLEYSQNFTVNDLYELSKFA